MVNIERDSHGKTRVAKGDKTGLGGQYAPDPELLARLKDYADATRKLLIHGRNPDDDTMSVDEYNEAVQKKEKLEEYYSEYNKQQEQIQRETRDELLESDGFTYFADFVFDVPTAHGMSIPNSDDGQPRGWQLRVGGPGSSAKTGTGFFATREEALAAVGVVNVARSTNSYIVEQKAKYDAEAEKKEAVRLDSSAPKGPWDMQLAFIEPEPNVKNPHKNGYHAGWCIVASSPEYNNGEQVFVHHAGYETRDDAVNARNEIVDGFKAWEGKYRSVQVDGVGTVLYNDMTHENYEKLINSFGFKPQPWLAYDHLVDYYPKSNYQGD